MEEMDVLYNEVFEYLNIEIEIRKFLRGWVVNI